MLCEGSYLFSTQQVHSTATDWCVAYNHAWHCSPKSLKSYRFLEMYPILAHCKTAGMGLSSLQQHTLEWFVNKRKGKYLSQCHIRDLWKKSKKYFLQYISEIISDMLILCPERLYCLSFLSRSPPCHSRIQQQPRQHSNTTHSPFHLTNAFRLVRIPFPSRPRRDLFSLPYSRSNLLFPNSLVFPNIHLWIITAS